MRSPGLDKTKIQFMGSLIQNLWSTAQFWNASLCEKRRVEKKIMAGFPLNNFNN